MSALSRRCEVWHSVCVGGGLLMGLNNDVIPEPRNYILLSADTTVTVLFFSRLARKHSS